MRTKSAWPPCKMPCLPVLLILAGANAFAAAPDHDWLPVTDAEMQMKSPVVDKTAGIEALFTRVHFTDDCSSGFERTSIHYVRLKVFNQEGKDKAALFDIPFGGSTEVSGISGRTIQPNGTILALGKDAIHERVTVKLSGVKLLAKSFALPGVEVGSIIEYRWTEIRYGEGVNYARLQFQEKFPVQSATYFLKPAPQYCVSGQLAVRPFNCKPSPLKREKDGFYSITLENIAAFREEPMMPSEANVRPWELVYYDNGEKRDDADKYWANVGKGAYGYLKTDLKANAELKQTATQTVSGAKDDNEKAVLLIRWIRANVRDLWGHHVTEAERKAVLKKMPYSSSRSAAEVVKSGIGTAEEMNSLFAALASGVGLDARPALIANRDDLVFDKRMVERAFLDNVDMGISIGGKWKIYDVGTRLLPPGMLSWTEEGVAALITDPKTPEFITAPTSSPADSRSTRTAHLSLAEDGAVEGDVHQTWAGHAAERRRRDLDGESAERQREDAKEEILKRFPQAEITALSLENADDAEKPLEMSYHIRVPDYASRTGKRILFQPLFFEHGDTPMFSAAERQYEVVIPYPRQDTDSVTIRFPADFDLENAESPGGMGFGKPGSYELTMSTRKGELLCTRQFTFGDNHLIAYTRAIYPKLKNVFDEVHRRDETTLSLKQAAAPGGSE